MVNLWAKVVAATHIDSSRASLGIGASASPGRGLARYYPFLIPSESSGGSYLATFHGQVKWADGLLPCMEN